MSDATWNTTEPFCDFVTVSQTHQAQCKKLYGGIAEGWKETDQGTEEYVTYRHKQIAGYHFTNLLIRSNGRKVDFSGNISRFNRSENVFGLTLDECKTAINLLLESYELPPFTGGETQQLQDGTEAYTGATFSRIDMTQNYFTGSPSNKLAYLQHIQTQTMSRMRKETIGTTTYFNGTGSRTIRIYDKPEQLKTMLKKSDDKKYLAKLIDYLDSRGTIRMEVEYHKHLKRLNSRRWDKATQGRLEAQFREDIKPMIDEIEEADLDDIPFNVLGTLLAYMAGIKVKDKLNKNTYYKHRKELKKYGYDISNENIEHLKPKQKTIILSVAEMPDFYKKAEKPTLKSV